MANQASRKGQKKTEKEQRLVNEWVARLTAIRQSDTLGGARLSISVEKMHGHTEELRRLLREGTELGVVHFKHLQYVISASTEAQAVLRHLLGKAVR